jgi:hypothetical protein
MIGGVYGGAKIYVRIAGPCGRSFNGGSWDTVLDGAYGAPGSRLTDGTIAAPTGKLRVIRQEWPSGLVCHAVKWIRGLMLPLTPRWVPRREELIQGS